MRWEKIVFRGLVMVAALPMWGQVPVRPMPTPVPAKPKVEPCWQVAGISKAAIEERATISRETRQEVEAVCANSSLSPQQKQQEIKQIHERAKQQMDALITPEQQSAMRSCQQERGHAAAPHVAHGGGGGPCGEISAPRPSSAGEDDDKAPSDAPKPN
jgi:hypothetical protein